MASSEMNIIADNYRGTIVAIGEQETKQTKAETNSTRFSNKLLLLITPTSHSHAKPLSVPILVKFV